MHAAAQNYFGSIKITNIQPIWIFVKNHLKFTVKVNVTPDVVADFRDMPFEDNTYDLIVFDPPHLKLAGPNSSIMKAQYGQLDKDNWAI